MTGTTAQTPSDRDGTGLPRPRQGSRWRWSRPHRALAVGGVLAAVLGLGVATGAGAATTTSGNSGPAAHGRPRGGTARPTVSGKITVLSGDTITVETNAKSSVTIVSSSSTTFKTNGGGGITSGASALKVGDFIGVTGTKNSDGSVTATTVMIGQPTRIGQGGPGGMGQGGPGGTGNGGKPPSGSGAPTT